MQDADEERIKMFRELPEIIKKKFIVDGECRGWKDNKPTRCSADGRSTFISIYVHDTYNNDRRYLFTNINGERCRHMMNIFSDKGRPLMSSGNGYILGEYYIYNKEERYINMISEESILKQVENFMNALGFDFDSK